MTILDTFAIKFTTDNVEQAKNDIKALDKQISELAAKGDKRNDNEKKQLDLLRKQRLAVTQDLKDQTRATDTLGDSFGGLATKILGVGAALFGLNSIKNGVLSAVDRNVGLQNQAKVGGQNPNDLRTIAAIVESAGGSGEGAQALIDSLRVAANARGLRFTNPIGLLNQANKDVQGKSIEDQARILEQLYGITDEALESELEKTTDEWRKIVDLKTKSTALTAEDYQDAVEFKGELTSLDQAWEKFYTKLGTATFPALEGLLGYVNHILDGLEAIVKIPGLFAEGSFKAGQYIGKNFNYSSGFGSNRGGGGTAPAIPSTPTSSTTPKTGNAAVDFWLSQGYTLNGALGMAANEQAESSGNPSARNMDKRGGQHYGLYQFDEQRRAAALSALGIDVATASADDQRKAAAWDAHNRGNDALINRGTSPGGAAAIANSYFEVSGESPEKRIAIANQLAAQYSVSQQGGAGGGLNVKIDNVTVNTQATDADGVSKDFATHLKGHLDDLYSDTNDGIDR